MKKKEKTIEEFREELYNIDIDDNKWKEKMLMVVKLYKSLGYKVKDVNEDSLIKDVYSYIATFLHEILPPTTEDFYKHVLIEREVNDKERIKERLTGKSIREMVLGDEINSQEDLNPDEVFLRSLYSSWGGKLVKTLIRDSRFKENMINFFKKKYPNQSSVELIKRMTSKEYGALDLVCEYVSEDKIGNKAFEILFVNELKEEEKKRRLEIRNGLVKRITTITNFFNQIGYLDEVMETNNTVMEKFGIPMKVAKGENKADFNILNLTNPDYYSQFTNEELFVFSAHYSNRLEKIVENLYNGIYLHAKLDTFYDTVDFDEIPRKITRDDAKIVLRQKAFLESLSRDKFKNLKDSVNDETKAEDLDFSYVPEEYIAEYKKVYESYFNRFLGQNTFEEEYRFIFSNRSLSYCMYALKDFSIESTLYTLSLYKSKINFGLIKERKKIKNEYGEEQVLIGIDAKECPTVRLHFPKKDFDEFVNRFFPDGDFPLYIGNDDFYIGDAEIKTQVLYKFTKKQKQAIKKMMDELRKTDPDCDLYKFIKHIYENIHPNKNPLNTKKNQGGPGDGDFDNK